MLNKNERGTHAHAMRIEKRKKGRKPTEEPLEFERREKQGKLARRMEASPVRARN